MMSTGGLAWDGRPDSKQLIGVSAVVGWAEPVLLTMTDWCRQRKLPEGKRPESRSLLGVVLEQASLVIDND